MRAKVKHKVAEHQKKAKKAAKKDVTWKSSASRPLAVVEPSSSNLISFRL